MALVPPDTDEYEDFVHGDVPDDEDWTESALQQATDLFWLATGLVVYPTDAQEERIAKYAIMEMAQYLLIQDDNTTEILSPYNSERIGSYSYSKAAQARNSIQTGTPLGLFWWDRAISLFSTDDTSLIWSSSEKVIPQPFLAHELVGTRFAHMFEQWRTWDPLHDEQGR